MDRTSIDSVDRVPHGGSTESGVIDFSANVNPETPPGIADVLREATDEARSYPPEPAAEFREAAGEYLDISAESVVPTPGGLAAIRLALEITLSPGDSVLVPYPSFGEYDREVRLQGGTPTFVPYDELLDAQLAPHELAIVCNPNNPTGDAYDAASLREFAGRARDVGTTILVDEAFLGFTDEPSLAGTEGVIVARSLTKLFGYPGLRAGFAVAEGEQADRLETARQTWNLGVPAMRAGIHSMHATGFVAETRERVEEERAWIAAQLGDRFEVHPSVSPFLLLDVGSVGVERVVTGAREAGIVVRDATTFRGLAAHVRVAVRRPEENRRLAAVLLDV